MALDAIYALAKDDLHAVDQAILQDLESRVPLVQEVSKYILLAGGKRIRPSVLLLSAKALQYQGATHIKLAAVIELIHTATLLHDDVIDDTTLRRGKKTAHAIWGGASSVLVGDFLYSRAFQNVVDLKNHTILGLFAETTHHIAEGEILQLVNCRNPELTLQVYFDIIERKTAKLFELAAVLGALLGKADEKTQQAFLDYGRHLGLAYQLIDDALDYQQSAQKTGKDAGQDLLEGKVTLPLIHALQHSTAHDQAYLKQVIQANTQQDLERVFQIIAETDAIQHTLQIAKSHVEKAKNALSLMPDSPYIAALKALSEFVIARHY